MSDNLTKLASELHLEFVVILDNLLNDLCQIDKAMPETPSDPEWWLEMKTVEGQARVAKRNIDYMYGRQRMVSDE